MLNALLATKVLCYNDEHPGHGQHRARVLATALAKSSMAPLTEQRISVPRACSAGNGIAS